MRIESVLRRFRHGLLAVDARIDSASFAARALAARAWDRLAETSARLRARGLARFGTELLSEGFTLAAAGAVAAVVLAAPAFPLTAGDWRAQEEYSVLFLDRYGAEIGFRGLNVDDSVPLSAYPGHLIEAVLATEDRRFFEHFGIDMLGTLRAVLVNAEAGAVVQGGSSITQQLAKLLFLTADRTIDRKIPEAFLALWLEANLTKAEILKLYLDRAYMGGGVFGVTAAAQFYFGKPIADITLAESAMLAGLLKAPSRYAPHINLPEARARAATVLDAIVAAGFMTEGQVSVARRTPATVIPVVAAPAPDYFLDWAYSEVKRLSPPGGGLLVVVTTFDPALQRQSEIAVEDALRRSGAQYRVSQAALVLMEPNGAVRAVVGGRDYGESQFNRATRALRQPGSSFKPFVYTAALMAGYARSTSVVDSAVTIQGWSPKNYAGGYTGTMTLEQAVARSVNTIPVKIAENIGRGLVIDTAHAMGIARDLPNIPSLPLGSVEVTVLEMANAYATLAAGGVYTERWGIEEIRTAEGALLYAHARDAAPPVQAIPDAVARDMNRMLNTAVNSGTGTAARIAGIPAAGKTGTTQSNRDAWFAGYTGNYVAVIWFGNDNFSTTNNLTGGSLPAQTWRALMVAAHAGVQLAALPGVSTGAAAAAAPPPGAASPAAPARADTLQPAALAVLAEIAAAMAGAEARPLLLPDTAAAPAPAAPPPAQGPLAVATTDAPATAVR